MLTGLPAYVIITFIITLMLTYQIFISAVKNKVWPSVFILLWITLTSILAYKEFFKDSSGFPPKLMLAVLPAIIFILVLLVSKKGQAFTDSLDLRKLTLLHIVRIPVELTLYWLAVNKAVPDLMTFTGRNFDIVAGITAPLIYFICFKGDEVKNRNLLLAWNFICLGLLLNIVINAVLSAPFSIQQFAFDQPNIAILYFPYVLLPSFIVMIVLFSHLVVIKRLLKNKKALS
jgi:hypothetical protein